MTSKCFRISGVMLLLSVGAFGQFATVTAHITEVVENTTPDGKVVAVHSRTGTYYRAANGSEVYRWTTSDGKPAFDGVLKDNTTGISYNLDFRNQTTHVAGKSRPTPPGLLRQDAVGNRPTDNVEGISCVVYTPKTNAGGSAKVCMSVEYFLKLWQDLKVPIKNGEMYHFV